MGFKDFCYVSCTFSVLLYFYFTLYLLKRGINQHLVMHTLMKYIIGQKFQNAHRIIMQEIGQWGR